MSTDTRPGGTINGLYPSAAYAEDQPYSHLILTTHVIHRGLPLGVLVSMLLPPINTYFLRRPIPTITTAASTTAVPMSMALRTLKSASTGILVTAVIMAGMVYGRMRGKEEIEWQDRSWRLLRNKGQVELDDWSAGGSIVGAMGGTFWKGGLPIWRGFVGGAGIGMLGGCLGYGIYKLVTKEKA